MRVAVLAGVGLVLAGAYAASQDEEIAATMAEAYDQAGAEVEDMTRQIKHAVTGWSLALVPEQYREPIAQAERLHGIPAGMLARLLWQESRFRPDAVNKKSGAQGIAQFMPETAAWLGVEPFNALNAINGAGRYLGMLAKQFGGDWAKALAAYNWGPGNVRKKGLAAAPAETRSYYSSILSDLGMA